MTIQIDPSRWKLPPYAHQVQGVKDLIAKPVMMLAFEMRTGKSKTVIDAACELHQAGELDVVVVVAPAQVIDVWKDREIGEIKTHCWRPYGIKKWERLWRANGCQYGDGAKSDRPLIWVLTSLEFLRQEGDKACQYPNVYELLHFIRGRAAWLVIDEASALGSPTSAQTRAVLQLRKGFERVTELDGTPASQGMLGVYSKMKVLDPVILGYRNKKHFLLNHAVYDKPGRYQRVVGFKNEDLIIKKTAPYVSRVEAKDVLDMPERIGGFISAALTPKTWDIYRRLRDEAIAELDSGTVTIQHAPVMVLRLAQVCSGFLGGVSFKSEMGEDLCMPRQITQELSSEATDALLTWLRLRLDEDPNFKCVIWSRWRAEIERLVKLSHGMCVVGQMWGDVKTENMLHPRGSYDGPFIMVAQPQAAQYGVSFAKADTEVFLSQGYSLVTRQQCEARIEAPDTRKHNYLVDMVVSGPKGERTVTHDVRAALLKKEDVALRTIAGWKNALEVE